MIHYALTDCPQGSAGTDLGSSNAYVQQYDAQQRQLWETYVSKRDLYYRMQPRWSDQPFWQRRRQVAEPSVARLCKTHSPPQRPASDICSKPAIMDCIRAQKKKRQ